MKIKVDQLEFIRALTNSNRSLSSKTNLPILANVLLEASKDKLQIVSTNLETACRVSVPCKVEVGGEITTIGKALWEFVSQLSQEEVDVEKLGEELVLKQGNFDARFSTMAASEFPAIPKVSGDLSFKIDSGILSKAIGRVVFNAALDESRPILTGVLCEFSKGGLNMVATDGYRLGFCEINQVEGSKTAISIIVPAKSLWEVAKIVGEGPGDQKVVNIHVSDNLSQASFKFGEVEFVSRLIEGEFPNWQRVIPGTFATKAVVSKVDFMKVIKMASIFAKDSGSVVKVKLEGDEKVGKLMVSAATSQVGSSTAGIDAKVTGAGGEIAFNFRYMLESLGSLEADEVIFEMNESLNPGRVTSTDDAKLFHIVMPVRLQGS